MSLYKPKSINECPECKRLREQRDDFRLQIDAINKSRNTGDEVALASTLAANERQKETITSLRQQVEELNDAVNAEKAKYERYRSQMSSRFTYESGIHKQ